MFDMPQPIDRPTPGRQGTIVVRTHYLDEILFRTAEALQRDGRYEVLFAIDERRREWDSGAFTKISLSEQSFSRLDLFTEDASFLWRLGDYVFYAAQQARPQAEFLWLLENDVVINAVDPTEPFRRLDEASGHDLLASHVGPSDPRWFWYRSMADRYPDVRRCFFPVVRLSRRAIDRLYRTRMREAGSYAARERDGMLVPNDEAFVATVLAAEGFTSADFNAFGDLYSTHTLDYTTLFNRHVLPPVDGRFYHAVLDGRAYASKLGRVPTAGADAIVAAAEHDPELTLDECGRELLIALDAALYHLADGEELVGTDSLIGRALALPHSERILNGIARCLVDAGKDQALSRLKLDHPEIFAGRSGPFRNVAKHKPATQSSTCAWSRHQDRAAEAAGANNNDRSMECGCHTDEEIDPWWQVDLGEPHIVHTIEIVNRRNMAQRLAGFRVEASLDGRSWDTVHTDVPAIPTATEFTMTPDPPLRCRLLRVVVPGRAILHMVEFAAFGVAEPADRNGIAPDRVG